MRITAMASPCLKSGVISVFITNLGKYNEGELVGEWLELPATSKELEHSLARIGIDGIHYEEYFLTDYESSIYGLSSYISEYSLLDELNELATQLAMLSTDEINLYQAAIEIGSSASSIHDLIHLADNLDSFQQLAGVNNEYDLGYYWIEESGCYDLAQLGHLSHYFDYERYGRDVCLEQGGIFHSGGYVYHTGG
ncbi:antirestriction protein ArdA [Providencia rettgeri]|uniref:antirestriction protein ArdA n=1 Tax=Providencia TaxID=586 RepID=UPI001CFC6980|nr:antirestriction protein ArdA [Providencia rettgeri]EIU7556843.1 antirestriction protein ArdA [Providencia rettgeri]EMA4781652.1 antirestriction protein ArdA [Providencia rettgeri]MCB4839262.1 antirestriction protein ArdA [Providencia rettgeri]HEM8305132.1 antirestriction protein ArdA [Providencia rettgeri]